MKNEMQTKILYRQNELMGIKSLMENQLKQNENILRMENDYSSKMVRMNEELAGQIKILHERNQKIEEDRKNTLKNYSLLEEKNREALLKAFNDKKARDEIQTEMEEKENNKSMIIRKETEKNTFNNNSFVDNNHKINESILNKSKINNKENEERKSIANNVNNSVISDVRNSPEKRRKSIKHKKGILDDIRKKKI